MPGAFSVRVEGLDTYKAKIRVLSPKQSRAVWRKAFRDTGRTIVQKAANRTLKAISRSLKGQLTTKATATTANVIARIGAKPGTRLASIGHLLEKGTSMHTIRVRRKRVLSGGGQIFGTEATHPGAPAQPWLEPALMDNDEKIRDDILQRIIDNIDKARA